MRKEIAELRSSVRRLSELMKGGAEFMTLRAAANYCGYEYHHFHRLLSGSNVKKYTVGRKVMVEVKSLNDWIRGAEG